MPLCLAAILFASFGLCRFVSLGVLAASRKLGFLDLPGARKAHPVPTPLGGGVGIFLCFVFVALLAPLAAGALPKGFTVPADLGQTLAVLETAARSRAGSLALLLGCAGMICVLGFWDDLRGVRPGVKLAVEALAAAVLYLALESGSFRVTFFWGHPLAWFLLTILWVVAVTNAFNFIDNMDGLCGTVSATSTLFFTVIAFQTGQFLIAAAFACLSGCVLGFLPLNLPPARLFLGDAGSLPLGFLIACLTVLLTFYEYAESPWVLAAPFLVLSVPLFDMLTVLWIRLREGRPLTVGDRSHFSHRLLALGMSPRGVLAVVGALGVATGMSAAILYLLPPVAASFALLQAFAILSVVWILERSGARK